ncbi:MAG TPA: isocitrate lyase/phosphoenolpyruvate mutase family protein, partial [Aminobacteriaceae bacterium]|nr:isocitrate lyase/phosphoenolpyruvate mutase family protein [Aminobacteriaceae bacterium]
MEKRGAQLRKLLARREILVAPGAYDGLSARLVESAGFEAVYVTGYGLSASVLGKPDTGLLTLTEMASRVSAIAETVSVPVIADGDTGYGNAVNVARTVREYEKAGAACIQLEDQVAPKKCGHMLGREVIPAAEMAGKIRAACDARRDDDFLIMARTDARTTHGIDEADVFALHQEGGQTCIQVFFFRTGQNWGNRAYFPRTGASLEPRKILGAFIAQFYDNK